MNVLTVLNLVLGILVVVSGFLIWLGRRSRPVFQMAKDWNGEPERKGPGGRVISPPRLSVMERIAALEEDLSAVHKELHPNHGSSARDAINRLEGMLRDLQREVRESWRLQNGEGAGGPSVERSYQEEPEVARMGVRS